MLQRHAVDARRALDVHEDVAAAALAHHLEQLGVGAAGDVVDRHGPRVQRPLGDLRPKRVGADRHAGIPDQALDRGHETGCLLLDGHRLSRPGRHRTDIEQVEALGHQSAAVLDRATGVSLRAPSKKESSVTFTIPAASGGGNSSTRSARRQRVTAT